MSNGTTSGLHPVPDFLLFWGKAQPRTDASAQYPRYHPVAYHSLDVAAVADVLLMARPLAARRIAQLLGVRVEEARTLVVALAGLHDLGKFTPVFQAKAPSVGR